MENTGLKQSEVEGVKVRYSRASRVMYEILNIVLKRSYSLNLN